MLFPDPFYVGPAQLVYWIVKTLIILAAMIAMSAGALHAYQKRNLLIQAALLSEGFELSKSVKSRVSDHFIQHGAMPHDNATAELPPAKSIYGTSVKRVSVNRSGVVMVDFSEAIGEQSMVFTPTVTPSGLLDWDCTSDSIDRKVLLLLKPNCNHNSVTNEGQLIKAIANSDMDKADQLLNAGANPNAVVNGNTPLMLAAKTGNVDAIKLLLKNGASVDNNALNSERRTPLMVAITSNNPDVVGLLLAEGASVTRRDYKGLSAQDHAVNTDRRLGGERYELMVLARLNPNFAGRPKTDTEKNRSPAEQTAHLSSLYMQLTRAAKDCHVQRLASLLKTEGDYDETEYVNDEPLAKQIRKPQCSTDLQAFIKTKQSYKAALNGRFGSASASCNLSELESLISANPDIDIMHREGLHSHFEKSIYSGCSNVVSFFIRHRKLENSLDGGLLLGAIRKAPQGKMVKLVGTLLEAGADVNYRDEKNDSPLAAAISLEHPVVAKYLVDAGADVNAETENGSYPIIEASKKGFTHLVSQLISKGANINQQDTLGSTALLAAVARGKNRLVDVLLRSGANPQHRNNNGISAVTLSESLSYKKIFNQLTASASNE